MPFANDPPREIEVDGELRLFELGAEDAEMVFGAVQLNREHLRAWLPWVDGTREVEDTRQFLEDLERRRDEGVTLAYALLDGERFLGLVGLHDINLGNANLQIGYWLVEAAQGQGVMTRAVAALLRLAFETLRMERIEIRCAAANARSSAIPERLGFSLEGTARHWQRLHGEFVDARVYSLLEREWRERAG